MKSSMQMFHSLRNNYRRMGNKIKQLVKLQAEPHKR